jgi:16S rRNA (uracil1498-N3)-methyltransferase
MAMFYVYHPEGFSAGSACKLDGEESHHLLRVLRATPRDTLFVFDGKGSTGKCKIQSAESRSCTVIVEEVTTAEAPHLLILLQGVVKNAAMDQIIHQATELGVGLIFPVIGTNCVIQMDEIHANKHLNRWRRIAIEACKQSKNPFVPQIIQPLSLDAALQRLPLEAVKIVASLQKKCHPWEECISRVRGNLPVIAAVGPEGDFSAGEYAALDRAGFIAVTLGPRILTTQTATVTLLGTLRLTGG